MNLADIRKKAGDAKKTDQGELAPPPPVTPSYELNYAEEFSEAPPDTESGSDSSCDPAPDSGSLELADPGDDSLDSGLTGLEELLSELPKIKTPPSFINTEVPAPVPSLPAEMLATVSSSAGFDPLAALLAGRASGAVGEDASSGDYKSISSSEIEEYLCFRVADEVYALNIMDIKEIIKPREVTEVPRMPGFISGVISLRGVIIPVMDMRLRLALPVAERSVRERVVVLRTDAGFCGVLVDEVIQVVRMDRSAIEDPPAVLDGIDREFVKGLGRVDNRMLILLNLESVLDLGVH